MPQSCIPIHPPTTPRLTGTSCNVSSLASALLGQEEAANTVFCCQLVRHTPVAVPSDLVFLAVRKLHGVHKHYLSL
ncbi:hypothetical protein CYMTET_34133 [Cymbomonas tetramitiformis]|uniref:Uncharacterized protein n=1 Tax=Cymbomonas tetramitiformis TaxID=36881 RepID=A0AAE0KQH3_9CHLO|nr:hypothetical protein CYMTET_34133 [Cymbomonas tetramitiformis]